MFLYLIEPHHCIIYKPFVLKPFKSSSFGPIRKQTGDETGGSPDKLRQPARRRKIAPRQGSAIWDPGSQITDFENESLISVLIQRWLWNGFFFNFFYFVDFIHFLNFWDFFGNSLNPRDFRKSRGIFVIGIPHF